MPDRVRLRRFDTQAEAEAKPARAQESGERAYILPPISAWGGKDPDWWPKKPAKDDDA
jgi:hypothetical protein